MHDEGLLHLGWDPFFEDGFTPFAETGHEPGRVTAEHRSAYVIATATDELWADVAGRLRHRAAGTGGMPAVGDWVALRRAPGGARATIAEVLPRRSSFSRKTAGLETVEQVVAANIDSAFLMTSLSGDLNLRRLERYVTMAWAGGVQPVIVLTKVDLCDDALEAAAEVSRIALGVPVHLTSSVTGEGIEELDSYLAGHRTVALLGSSGVGKSSLVNRLVGREVLRVQELRDDGRGRHTTTHRQLVALPGGGLILDTPGMRELQLWDDADAINETFEDIAILAQECRFRDCSHDAEPGCAVQEAIAGGRLAPARLESFRKLQRELRHLELKRDRRAAAEERRRYRVMARSRRQ